MEGGGEKNGMEGIVVGIVGIFTGIFGKGGRVTWGTVGMAGSGGTVVGLGKDGCGRFGILGKGGTLPAWGSVGIGGNGGSVGLGRLGKFGEVVCRRWRAAWLKLKLMLDKVRAIRNAVMKELWNAMTLNLTN